MISIKITAENRAEFENKEIVVDGNIEIGASLGLLKFVSLKVSGSIVARDGSGIEAGWGIEAGLGIEAGWGIKAEYISVKLRIFAGMCMHRIPTDSETEIRAEIRSGYVAFGKVVGCEK